MTTLSMPLAPTVEKQKEWAEVLWHLTMNAAAQARGEGERKLTPKQYEAMHEMLAAAPADEDEKS